MFKNVEKFVLEDDYPYQLGMWLNTSSCCPYDCRSSGKTHALEVRGYEELYPMVAEDLKKQIWLYGPISVYMTVVEEMQFYNGGILDCDGGNISGSHMVVAVGYGPGYIALRNSWGPDWGLEGDFLVSDRSDSASCNILASDSTSEYLQMVRVSVKPLNGENFERSITLFIGCLLYLPVLGATILALVNEIKRNGLSLRGLLLPVMVIIAVISLYNSLQSYASVVLFHFNIDCFLLDSEDFVVVLSGNGLYCCWSFL